MMVLSYPSVPASHDSVTVSLHAQYQDPETEAAKWNPAIINFIISVSVKTLVSGPFHILGGRSFGTKLSFAKATQSIFTF